MNSKAERKIILFQGDSITDALRIREDEENLGMGYPAFTAGELGVTYPGQFLAYNRGVSGNRVVDLYARIKKDIINLHPDYLSILIGINDVWHEVGERNGVDAEKYGRIYQMLVEEVKEALPEVKIMIQEPFVLKASATIGQWDTFRIETGKRAGQARQVAERNGLLFIPLQERFDEAARTAPEDFWLRDGVHPTPAGHALIKDAWMEGFRSHFR